MTRVVPSQVVRFIADAFAWSTTRAGSRVDQDNALAIAAIIELVGQVPEANLAALGVEEHAHFLSAIAAMRAAVAGWRGVSHPSFAVPLAVLPGLRGWHPVSLVRSLLEKCPDETPALGTHELAFLGDAALQFDLRLDISNARNAHGGRDFKSATVLCGSVIEALLYWALRQVDEPSLRSAIAASSKTELKPTLARWDFAGFLAVEEQLRILKSETRRVADTVRNYRNLIHPERAARLGMVCDEGTSLVAIGGVLQVIRDVDAWARSSGSAAP